MPIIALSANAFQETVRESLAAGFDAHLAKPVSRQVLLRAVTGFCRQALRREPQSQPSSFIQALKVKSSSESIQRLIELDPAESGELVTIDSVLAPLLEGVKQTLRHHLTELDRAIEGERHEAIRDLGHVIKGLGMSFNMNKVAQLGRMIQDAGELKHLDEAGRAATKLKSHLEKVKLKLTHD
jgi:CheY-like chemotaxis protein